MPESEWWGYSVRYECTKEYISGRGIEIGPGVNPQRVPEGTQTEYFDKRTAEQLEVLMGQDVHFIVRPMADIPKHFPRGADYLIAHQVLEHIVNPISALMQWHAYLRENGRVILSVPDAPFAPGDRQRAETPLDYILQGYLLDRQEADYDARIGIPSFCLGWHSEDLIPYYREFSTQQMAVHLLSETKRMEGHDLHWYAAPSTTWQEVIRLAGWFAGKSIEFDAIINHDMPSEVRPESEVIFVYRMRPVAGVRPKILDSVAARLELALKKLAPR